MQKIVFFDLDGTLIDEPSSEKSYIFWLLSHGQLGYKQIFNTFKFCCRWLCKLKNEVFVKNKAYLSGLQVTSTVAQAKEFTYKKLLPRLRPHIVARLEQHREKGDIIILLTGAPQFIAEVFAEQLKIPEIAAAEFHIENGYFNNAAPQQHPYAKEKLLIAKKICAKYNHDINSTVAYANSIHDRTLMENVGEAIAVTPDRRLRKIAKQRGWEIIESSRA